VVCRGVLEVRCEGKRSLGRPRLRWEDTIKWILKKWGGLDCSGLGLGQVACAGECGNDPSGSITFREFLPS
jgi:hypothetical protein